MTSNKHTADPPTPLFPRKVVIEMYRTAHSEASWGGVARTAQAIENPIELDWLITQVETDFTHFCPDGQTFEAANQTWVRMSEFAPTLSMFSSAEPDRPAEVATSVPSAEHESIKILAEAVFEFSESPSKMADGTPFAFTPPWIRKLNPRFEQLNQNVSPVRGRTTPVLDLNPVRDLELDLQRIWNSFLPLKTDTRPSTPKKISQELAARIASVWNRLVEHFRGTWTAAAGVAQETTAEEDAADSSTLVAMGHFLADINVIVGAFVLDHHMYGASLHKSYADAPLLSLGEGLFDEIARINLMRDAWVLRTKYETNRQLQLADLLGVTPLMPPGLRYALLSTLTRDDREFIGDCAEEIAATLLLFWDRKGHKDRNWSSEEAIDIQDHAELVARTPLKNAPLSEENFFDVSSTLWFHSAEWSTPLSEERWFFTEIFCQQQSLVYERISVGRNPWRLERDGDKWLTNTGMLNCGIPPPGVRACSLWCIAEFLESLSKPRENILEEFSWMANRLRSEGYSQFVSNFLDVLLWRLYEKWRFWVRHCEESDLAAPPHHAPLGSWAKLRDAFSHARGSIGYSSLTRSVIILSDLFRYEKLDFAALQLLSIAEIDEASPTQVPAALHEVSSQLNQPRRLTLEDRSENLLTSLLGEEFWSKFPEEEQKRLLSLESHFVFLQYEEAFGYKSDAWVLDYWRLIENPIINCVASVRGDTTFLGPFISICSSLKIEVEKDKELSAAHAIKILRNFRSFAPQFKEKFIERLSFYGIQAHLLTSELLDKIDRLRKIRNNCVHGRRTNPSDDPAKDFRKIFFEAYPAFYHAIKR